MVRKKHNDDVILEKLDHIKESVEEIKNNLVKLNGTVKQNTGFRHQQKIINVIIGAIGVSVLGVVLKLLF